MNNIELEIHDDVITVLNKIDNTAVGDINLAIPEGSVLFDNILSLKLIKKEMENSSRKVVFKTDDPLGKKQIALLSEDVEVAEGFTTREIQLNSGETNPVATKRVVPKLAFKKPSFSNLPILNIKMPKIHKFNFKLVVILLLLILGIGGGVRAFVWKAPEAVVTLTVSSQPLIKSITVKAGTELTTSPEAKTLNGSKITASASETKKLETTGEKLVGEKAEGSIKLINRTSSSIKLEKGDTVYYEDDSDIEYTLNNSVTIPAQTLVDPDDPLSASTPGEAKVSITAKEFGDDYNLDDKETLRVDDFSKSDLTSIADGKIDGGSSKTVKIVAEEDLTKLAEDISTSVVTASEKALEEATPSNQTLVKGSVNTVVAKNEYTGVVGDELDEVELTQTVTASGLAYSITTLDTLLDRLVEEFVPNGYKLADQNREVNVEILGNSDDTVLSSSEADLQVTLKTFVIPDISPDKVITDITGKKLDEANSILNSIRNVKSSEIYISPNIPLYRRMPPNRENITVEIKLEK